MFLFVISLVARLVFFLDFTPLELLISPASLARLRPRTRNLLIKFCADSVRCLSTIYPALTSGYLCSSISVRILPPVQNVSRLTTLGPLHRIGRTQAKESAEKIVDPVSSMKGERGGIGGSDNRGKNATRLI